PRALPYGGQPATLIRHLTIATRLADAELDRIQADVERWLPIECSVDACEVWEHAADGWRMMHAVPLRQALERTEIVSPTSAARRSTNSTSSSSTASSSGGRSYTPRGSPRPRPTRGARGAAP